MVKKKRWLALMVLVGLLLAAPVWAVALLFTEHTIKGDFDGAYSVYATDLDGDGNVDVLGAAGLDNDITWWENDPSGNPADPINWTEHTIADNFDCAYSVYAADLDGDGNVDVLGAAFTDDDITWWENDPSGNPADPINWTEHTIEGNFNGARSVYAADLDGDGNVDVLGAAGIDDDITWWENDPSGNPADPINWTKHTIDNNFDGAHSVYATDLDGDGDVDVLGAPYGVDKITWWENDPSGNPADPINWTPHIIDNNFSWAKSVYAEDVDGDGDMDVLGAAYDANDIIWWENDGSQSFTERTIDDNFSQARSVYATDLDGDGNVDVLGAAFDADDITWWENDPSGNPADPITWTPHIIDDNFNGAHSVYATDLDGLGHVDVLGAARYDNDITWWENPTVCYSLTTNVIPAGSGAVNADPAPYCAGGKYIEDTVVNLTAVPNATWQFKNWTGHKTGTTNPTTITMDSDKDVTANFQRVHTVSRPNRPTGTSLAARGERVCYRTGGSTDNLGHTVLYRFYWGDGTFSPWRLSRRACHTYTRVGTYRVQTQARCSGDPTVRSSWSPVKRVRVIVHRVSRPNTPTGPAKGRKGQRLCYFTGGSRDTLGHRVQYRFRWGDGKKSKWSFSRKACHRWLKPGRYKVKAQARCSVKRRITSSWSRVKAVRIRR